jgi:magnesium chelatase subunit D
MTRDPPAATAPDTEAAAHALAHAAALLAVEPAGLGGAWLRGPACALRQAWLDRVRALLPEATPWRRVPLHIQDAELLGGLDLGATLQAGRPVARDGVLAQAHGGLVLLPMAERHTPGLLARLHAVLDTGRLPATSVKGAAAERPVHIGAIALDEGQDDDATIAPGLAERLALHLDLNALTAATADAALAELPWTRADVAAARERLPHVTLPAALVEAVCATALALGIHSLRAPLQALRVARVAAALSGDDQPGTEHAALAMALVLAPRATRWPSSVSDEPAEAEEPAPPPESAEPPPPPESNLTPPDAEPPADDNTAPSELPSLEDVLLAAARAAIPPGLLAQLIAAAGRQNRGRGAGGRAGKATQISPRGRPQGARRGTPGGSLRLSLIDTLRAAAPWQRVRAASATAPAEGAPRVRVRPEDFHVVRRRQVRQTTTLFLVDASGSSALHRLAEAKGAVELLLADCYVRRDRVAVLAFRGTSAELLLPPTRSLARAKRGLAGLPGGGGTPLAAALTEAGALVDSLQRRGEAPQIVLLTDGRANIALDGTPGRERATTDALSAARRLRASGVAALVIDTSPQPMPSARTLADTLGATYLPLPHAGSDTLSRAVRSVQAASRDTAARRG